MNCAIIINNMASRCPIEKFSRTFDSIFNSERNSGDTHFFIVDDSGINNITNSEYYGVISVLPNVHVIKNEENICLLASRFSAFSEIRKVFGDSEVVVRYLDAGDIAINNQLFWSDIDQMEEKDLADWYIFSQRGLEGDMVNLDAWYFSCLGNTKDTHKVQKACLSALLCSTMWTKIFKLSLLEEVKKDLEDYFAGSIPYLFHTEDYLISCLYALKAESLKSLDFPYIAYDYLNGASNQPLTSEQKIKLDNDLKNVYDCVFTYYSNLSDIPKSISAYFIKDRQDSYRARFK